MISETKLDISFPKGQFLIPDYSTPYTIGQNCNGEGIILFIREDIPSKRLFTKNAPIEGFDIGLNLRKKTWLL